MVEKYRIVEGNCEELMLSVLKAMFAKRLEQQLQINLELKPENKIGEPLDSYFICSIC